MPPRHTRAPTAQMGAKWVLGVGVNLVSREKRRGRPAWRSSVPCLCQGGPACSSPHAHTGCTNSLNLRMPGRQRAHQFGNGEGAAGTHGGVQPSRSTPPGPAPACWSPPSQPACSSSRQALSRCPLLTRRRAPSPERDEAGPQPARRPAAARGGAAADQPLPGVAPRRGGVFDRQRGQLPFFRCAGPVVAPV